MQKSIRVKGWDFKYDESNEMYECRGSVMYDDEHDEMPEPSLWSACLRLAEMLKADGYEAEPEHSEKGWVEVQIINN